MEKLLQNLLGRIVPQLEQCAKRTSELYWEMTTTGSSETEQKYMEAKEAYLKVLSNKEDFRQLKEIQESDAVYDALLRRQLTVLYHQFLPNQVSDEKLTEMIRLETEIEGTFAKFRALYKGERISDNDINKILADETDSVNRKEVWEASKQIGTEVAPTLIALVKLRNEVARELGYENYYKMALASQEMNEAELFGVLDKLKVLTDRPFAEKKKKLDEALAKKFGISLEAMRPWHYSDRFFQEVPKTGTIDDDKFYEAKDIVEIAKKYYDSIGLDVQDILDRSDLYEREGKNQHAYCIHIDRSGDVRTLNNIVPNPWWMSTLLHELGHGVYDKYLDMSLPWLLREPAHMFATEAVAMLFGRLTQNPEWLEAMADVPHAEASDLAGQLQENLTLSMLVFIRWALVMVYFERELYENPDQSLNTLWWDKVEALQFITRPEGRENAQDWASKIHLGTAPVYYQNYILGELAASQMQNAVMKHTGSPSMVNNPKIGEFLIESIFRPANKFYWNEMLTLATGAPLSPEHFVNQFVK